MALEKLRFASLAAGLITSLAASTAGAQAYNQPAAGQTANPGYANPQYPAPGQRYANPAAQNANPQYAAPSYAGAAGASGNGTQPVANAYQQGGRQAAPATNRYAAPRGYQAPGPVTYPEAAAGRAAPTAMSAASGAAGVRPAQFEQPLDQQPRQAVAQQSAPQQGVPQQQAPQQAGANDPPSFRATEISASALPTSAPAEVAAGQNAQEHPLMPALRWAKQGLDTINKVQDYSCTLVKRERIDGTLGEHEYMFVKVRHQPFSVYTYFLGPARVKGQEAIFVDGQNEGSLLAHGNGIKHRLIGTVQLKPTSMLAMSGNRYPITEMGIRRLLERLLEIGSNDVKYGECTVKYIQGAKVNNRVCTCIQVEHPHPRRNFLFHLARIYVDDEMQLPIRYEAYEWPAPGTNQPQLTEEYTFLNVKVNNGFSDADFSTDNPTYGFK